MDDRLRLIQYLYDEEDGDAPSVAHRLSEDDELYREYERLRTTKKRLDARPSSRPDPAVVDRVVDHARVATQEPPAASRREDDRPARSPSPSWSSRLQAVSAALVLGFLVGLGWWQVPEGGGSTAGTTAAPSVDETPASSTTPAAAGPSMGTDAVPAWDDSDELVRIHRRIEQLQAHSAPDRWGSTLQQVNQIQP